MSQGDGDARGSWNQGAQWQFVSDRNEQMGVDGGGGEATVKLPQDQLSAVQAAARRTASDPNADPTTGAELGSGPRRRGKP